MATRAMIVFTTGMWYICATSNPFIKKVILVNYHDIAISVLFVVVSYLVGSIPFGYIIGMFHGVDVCKHGSRNLGATNAFRLLGPTSGTLTFVLDFAKGFLPALLAFGYSHPLAYAVGCAAIIGHCCSVYLSIKERYIVGGKAVTTTLGVASAFIPVPTLIIALCAFACIFALTRYVSLSSMVAAVVAALIDGFIDPNIGNKIFLVVATLLIIYKHRENIKRLLSGTERKMGNPPTATEDMCGAFVIHPQQWETLTRCFLGKILYKLWCDGNLTSRELFWIGVWFGPFLADDYIVPLSGGNKPIRMLIISTLFLPEHYKNPYYQSYIERVLINAARMAQRLGATTIGLGAFNSTFGEKGKWLQDYLDAHGIDMVVTNGGNYTAQGISPIIARLSSRLDSLGYRVVVIGAGAVGYGIVSQLLGNSRCTVITIAPNSDHYRKLIRHWQRHYSDRIECYTCTDPRIYAEVLPTVDVCFTATSAGETLINVDILSHNGDRKGKEILILDASTTRDVSPDVGSITGVTFIRFGAVIPLGRGPKFEMHGPAINGVYPIPLCLAETMMLAYIRYYESTDYARQIASLDVPSSESGRLLFEIAQQVGLATFVEF